MKPVQTLRDRTLPVHALVLALLRLCKRRGVKIKITPPKRINSRQLPLLEERKPLT